MPRILALDAMGVLYRSGDDVGELLEPFVREHGGDAAKVAGAYHEASLGEISPDLFWEQVGLSPELEDAYLDRHELAPGVEGALTLAQELFGGVCCLSNDVSRWSLKLRRKFGLETHISGWFISGEMWLRKPDPRIYQQMIDGLGVTPNAVSFVDDREKNVAAAQAAGINAVLFQPGENDLEAVVRALGDGP